MFATNANLVLSASLPPRMASQAARSAAATAPRFSFPRLLRAVEMGHLLPMLQANPPAPAAVAPLTPAAAVNSSLLSHLQSILLRWRRYYPIHPQVFDDLAVLICHVPYRGHCHPQLRIRARIASFHPIKRILFADSFQARDSRNRTTHANTEAAPPWSALLPARLSRSPQAEFCPRPR